MLGYADQLRARRYEHATALSFGGGNVSLSPPSDAIVVGGAGTVVIDTVGGEIAVSFTCVAGQVLPVSATKVYSSSTATAMVAVRSQINGGT